MRIALALLFSIALGVSYGQNTGYINLGGTNGTGEKDTIYVIDSSATTYKVLAADKENYSDVFNTASDLSFDLEASTTYVFQLSLMTGGLGSEGITVQFGSTSALSSIDYLDTKSNNRHTTNVILTASGGPITNNLIVSGSLTTGSATTLSIELKKNADAHPYGVTIYKGSWAQITKL